MAGTGGRARPGRRLRRVDETSAGGLVVADDGVLGPRAALIGRTSGNASCASEGSGRRQGMSRVTFSHFACWLNIESTMWMKAS